MNRDYPKSPFLSCDTDPIRVASALRAEFPVDHLRATERDLYLECLDDVIENGGTIEEANFLAELRAEGGWGAEDDGTLIHYDGQGDVVEVI